MRVQTIFLAVCIVAACVTVRAESLVERLGFPADARVLIVNGDDFGMNHSTNVGTEMALECGGLTSSTIMTPCPWANEALDFGKTHPQACLGVHLTQTSEWKHYKWGPVMGWKAVPTLCDSRGYFYEGPEMLYFHGDPRELEKEIRAQIDRALAAGVDVTHVDSHMGTLNYSPGYHAIYARVAKDYGLPARIAASKMRELGFGYVVDKADALGVLHPDIVELDSWGKKEDIDAWYKNWFDNIEPGKVTELYIHCGRMTPEMEATTGSAQHRAMDTDYFCKPETHAYIQEKGIELISYRELRELQRTGKPMPRKTYGWKE